VSIGSNRGVEVLLKGIGGVGVGVSVGEGAGDGDGVIVIVIFSFPRVIKLAMSGAKTLGIPIPSTNMIDNAITHMVITFFTSDNLVFNRLIISNKIRSLFRIYLPSRLYRNARRLLLLS
jgi:hypothetical protein